MSIVIESKAYRYTENFTATVGALEYSVDPIRGRPENSYFVLLNTGSASIEIAFGDDSSTEPTDFFSIAPGGSYEPLHGFFTRGRVNMWVKGTSEFTVIR